MFELLSLLTSTDRTWVFHNVLILIIQLRQHTCVVILLYIITLVIGSLELKSGVHIHAQQLLFVKYLVCLNDNQAHILHNLQGTCYMILLDYV